ncbi:MAG: deoxynucleoside kinase [Deltaproteobacteria bacterium]|nr:deoxynucleoside kinase [Deltaproteobacteria bacterium]NIS77070.1 deoxynucleoside kinase [Deltaproteobacteria bacterium]
MKRGHEAKTISPTHPRYIAVEGAIGVGKTSLARFLADVFKGKLILEEVEKNPFLERFYEDREKYAFQAQIFFLLSRYRQMRELMQGSLFEQFVVSDYILQKDKIFAYINLEDDELQLYEALYRLLGGNIPKPDLVIYLQAKPEILMQRIRKRNQEYERNISLDYLRTLSEAYNEFFFHYVDTPLLVVNTSEIDFVESPRDLEHLIKEIKSIKKGVQHYIPLGSR